MLTMKPAQMERIKIKGMASDRFVSQEKIQVLCLN